MSLVPPLCPLCTSFYAMLKGATPQTVPLKGANDHLVAKSKGHFLCLCLSVEMRPSMDNGRHMT